MALTECLFVKLIITFAKKWTTTMWLRKWRASIIEVSFYAVDVNERRWRRRRCTCTCPLHRQLHPSLRRCYLRWLCVCPLRDVASAFAPRLAIIRASVRARATPDARKRARAYYCTRAHPVRLWEATLARLLTHEEATCLNCIFFSILPRWYLSFGTSGSFVKDERNAPC